MALRPKDWPPPGALFALAASELDPLATEEEGASAPATSSQPVPPASTERFDAAAATCRVLAAHLLGREELLGRDEPLSPRSSTPGQAEQPASHAAPLPAAHGERHGKRPESRSGGGGSGGGATSRKAKRRSTET